MGNEPILSRGGMCRNTLTCILSILSLWICLSPLNISYNDRLSRGAHCLALEEATGHVKQGLNKLVDVHPTKMAKGMGNMVKDAYTNYKDLPKDLAESVAYTAKKTYNGLNFAKDAMVSTAKYASGMKQHYNTYRENDRRLKDEHRRKSERRKSKKAERENASDFGFSDEFEPLNSSEDLDKEKKHGTEQDSEPVPDQDAENRMRENIEQLDKLIGFETFLRPFISSLKPEQKALIKGQKAAYVQTYKVITQRLLALINPVLSSTTNFEGSSAIGEIFTPDHETFGTTPKTQSFLELFQPVDTPKEPNSVGNNGGSNPTAGAGENDRERVRKEKPRVRLLNWRRNGKLYHTTLLKSLYLLSSDILTHDLKQRLENLAEALGYSIINETAQSVSDEAKPGKTPLQKAKKRRSPLPIEIGADLFWACGDNPFILGHLSTLMLGYIDYNAYFSEHATRKFYSWLDIISSGTNSGVYKLDAMCGVKRGSKYKRGSNGAIQKNNNVKRIINKQLSSEVHFLCNILEVLLRSIGASLDSMGELLNHRGATYEPNVGPITNGKRIQAKLCSNTADSTIVVRCEFERSNLNRQSAYKDVPEEEVQDIRRRYHEAFDLFMAISDVKVSNKTPKSWFNILSDPTRYRSLFEMTLMWDPRLFTSTATTNTWMGKYSHYEATYVGLNLNTQVVPNYNSREYYKRTLSLRSGEGDHKAWIRYYIYMASSGMKEWIERNMTAMQQIYEYAPSVLLGGALSNRFRDFYNSTSVGLGSLFLYHVLSQKNAADAYCDELNMLRRASIFSRVVDASNLFVPNKFKKIAKWFLKGGLAKKFMREKTKASLKQLLDADVLRDALTSIKFVTHSLANLQINQNAHIWGNSFFPGGNSDDIFRPGGAVGSIDSIIREWSNAGYSNSIAEKLKKGIDLDERDLKVADFQHLHNSESVKWDKHLNLEILKAYNKFLELPSIKPLEGKGHLLYEIVKDSRDNLEQNLENTIFFGRIVQPGVINNRLKKFFKDVVSFGRLLLNKSSHPVEHAVWFGVTLDIDKIIRVVDVLHKLQKQLSGNESWNLQGGFIDLIDDLVDVFANDVSRTAFGTVPNFGMPSISNMYGRMSVDERRVEIQQSMCAKHCSAIWKAILAFSLSTLRNPGSIKSYEKNLSKNSSLSEITSPGFVNSYRFILKGDAMMHMYDTMLPKAMKRELKSIKYGKAFYFANVLKLASILLDKLGFVYTATTLKMQAPYFGNFISDWGKKREDSKMKQLVSAVTLGTMATYTLLECMDIAQHAHDVGIPPTESCFYLLKPPSYHCIVNKTATIALKSSEIAVRDVFSSTILALVGPYFFLPMGTMAAWNVLKHQFKILHRLDIAVSVTMSKLWNRIRSGKMARRVAQWFRNRRQYRKKIETVASNKPNKHNEDNRSEEEGEEDTSVSEEEIFDDGNTFSYTHFE